MQDEIVISDSSSLASSDEETMEIETVIDKQKLADEKKNEGNLLYQQKKYNEALECYSKAIDLCPNSSAYYGNRAACHMMAQNYLYALEDIQQSTKLDPTFIKGHLREVRCQIALGDIAAAKRSLERIKALDPKTPELTDEMRKVLQLEEHANRVDLLWHKKEYRQALFHLDQLLKVSASCLALKLKRAECLALLGRYQESQEIANDILMRNNLNADAIYIRGLCLYYQDNIEKAVTHFQSVLQLAPDHQKALDAYKKTKLLKVKKEAGNAAFKNGDYQEAYNLYTSALAVDPSNISTNAKLYFNRATVCSKIKKVNQAVEDSTQAIKLDPNYTKAFLRRAKSYMELEMFEEAVADYESVYQKDKARENRRLLDNAKLELKKSKRKDYYKVLGVSKNATDDEIKKAYKKQALIHHPDRHSNETDEKKMQQEKKFKELGEAYNILSDPKKKSRYDNGLDLEEDGVGGGYQDFDPNMFSTFFAGPGGFHFASSGGGNHYTSSGGQGFPRSGFQFQFS